jgi:putative DNA primase/helicase
MPVSRQEASEALEDFKREYTGLSQVKYVLLENKKDFHDHYGPNAERSRPGLAGKLGAYSRSTRTIALALAAHDDKSEIAATLAHEGIGHSGINTFSGAEKRGLIDALMNPRSIPALCRIRTGKPSRTLTPIWQERTNRRDFQPHG